MNLLLVGEEPLLPTPTPEDLQILVGPPIILIALVVLIVIAWKYKAILDLIFIVCSTLAGFVIGLLRFSPISMGFAMMCAVAGLFISGAIDALIRLLRSTREPG